MKMLRRCAGATTMLAALAVLCSAWLIASARASDFPLGNSRQLIVVTTADWSATTGTLQRFENSRGQWKRVGAPISVVIGRGGLGWGSGIGVQARPGDSPVKKEGDGRSPAGVFPIGAAFGYDSNKPSWLRVPYIPLTDATECVDDRESTYYNSVVDRVPTQPPGWKSSEKMRQIAQYRWGLVVEQNSERARGAGSCIFLHIWSGPQEPTAGCTAMQQRDLEEIMRWLDASARPLLVALPAPEYERVRLYWRLPSL